MINLYFDILFSSDNSRFSVSSFRKKAIGERLWIVIQTIHAQYISPIGMVKYTMHFGTSLLELFGTLAL